MVKTAGSQDELAKAEAEMDHSVDAAPWWGDAYFNRGLIREKLGHFREAIEDFKVYQKVSPDAKDAEAVDNKIVTLEIQAEKSPGRAGKASIEWVKIPGGTFMMGSNGSSDEKPVHKVTIQAFEMAKTLVTVEQYKACVDAGACSVPQFTYSDIRYCNWGTAYLVETSG